MTYAVENAWEQNGMTENDNNMSSWTDACPAQLGEKDLEWNTQDFYPVSGASANAQQSWVNSQNDNQDTQTPQDDEQDEQAPQNDEEDTTDTQEPQNDNHDSQTPQEDDNDGSFIDKAFQLLANNLPLMAPLMNEETDTSSVIKNIDYQHEKEWKDPFTYGFISIEDPDNPGHGITIMDRNLWATTTWAGTVGWAESYGYYYQWGNNYGFPTTWDITNTTSNRIDVSSYWPSEYSSGTFVTNWEYTTSYAETNMWWWEWDDTSWDWWYPVTNPEDRQWPCPAWTHVPTAWERSQLLDLWVANYNKENDTSYNLRKTNGLSYISQNWLWTAFANELYIPFAGVRNYSDASLYSQGGWAYLWSSSPYSAGPNSHLFYLRPNDLYAYSHYYRAYAFPVRCFYDSYQTDPSIMTVSFDTDGGSDIASKRVRLWKTIQAPSTPTKPWAIFGWRYEDPDFEWEEFDFSTPITEDIALYAKWIEIQTISIPDPNDPTKWYTIMDRNLWATTTWAWENSDPSSYGYYYQRWNNYPFPWVEDRSANNIQTSTTKVNVSAYWPNNPYYSGTFIRNNTNWTTTDNGAVDMNLWWWWTDAQGNNRWLNNISSTVQNRQWPCPAWYHVPSAWERSQLLKYYVDWYNKDHSTSFTLSQNVLLNNLNITTWSENLVQSFVNDLVIPYAHIIGNDGNGWVAQPASFLSSSPRPNNSGKTWRLRVEQNRIQAWHDVPRAHAQSLRCFANQYTQEQKTVQFVSDDEVYTEQSVVKWLTADRPDDPVKDWYTLAWWYTNPNFEWERFSFTTRIQEDTVLYAKWLEYDTIYIEDPNNPWQWITIMDRNLGATTTGAWQNSDPSSYGYYYQRWNNYGFDYDNFTSIDMPVWWAKYNPQYDKKWYYGETFIKNSLYKNWYDYWTDSTNNSANHADLRWWANDNNWSYPVENFADRQWPCPEWRHVPSQGEWTALINMRWETSSWNYSDYTLWTDYTLSINQNWSNIKWSNSNIPIASDFADMFSIPYAWWVRWDNAVQKWDGSWVNMHSSSVWSLSFSSSFVLESETNVVYSTQSGRYRSYWLPIRCFYNEYEPIKHTISFKSEWEIIATQEVTRWLTWAQLDNPDRKWYTFIWWYDNSDFSGDVFDFENTPIKSDITLYAKWKKNPGWSGRWNSRTLNDEWDATHWSADDMTQSLTWKYIIPEDKQAEKWDMHQRAYDNWLTIYKPWEDAKFDQPLTRQQMAKISSVFWANFLGQQADASEWNIMKCSQYEDLSKSKWEMRWYVVQSCLLWNMWYAYDGVNLIKKFKPYDKLTVAQASVILSRMVYWDKYILDSKQWYQWHMQAVYDHGLIADISDPSKVITRWEAFMMMYRLSQIMENEK